MPRRTPLRFLDATHVVSGGRTWLYAAGCNYLGLSFHPRVRAALRSAALDGPLQAGASRATTGEQPGYRHLEQGLARFFRVEDASLVATGYLAPIAASQALAPQVTHVLLDDAAHACVADGARLTGRPVRRFAHGDIDGLADQLRGLPRSARPLVACDGTRGTRGGLSPIAEYLTLLPESGFLLVDDAHGAGVVGPGGRGACALLGLRDPRLVQVLSLAKAFGVGGGAVLGSRELTNALRGGASGWIGSTAPLLPAVAALQAALDLIQESPGRVRRLQAHCTHLHSLLPRRPGIFNDPRTPVVGLYPTSVAEDRALHRRLRRAGIHPPRIIYRPSGDAAFYRFAITAAHTRSEVERLATVITGD